MILYDISYSLRSRNLNYLNYSAGAVYGLDSLDLCELASKEVSLMFSERAAYPSPLNSKL